MFNHCLLISILCEEPSEARDRARQKQILLLLTRGPPFWQRREVISLFTVCQVINAMEKNKARRIECKCWCEILLVNGNTYQYWSEVLPLSSETLFPLRLFILSSCLSTLGINYTSIHHLPKPKAYGTRDTVFYSFYNNINMSRRNYPMTFWSSKKNAFEVSRFLFSVHW